MAAGKRKKGLGNKPPKVAKPRPGRQYLYISFDPATLLRDQRTNFTVDQRKECERWLDLEWKRAKRAEEEKLEAAAEGKFLTSPLEDCVDRAMELGIKLNKKPASEKTLEAYGEMLGIFVQWLEEQRPSLAPFRIEHITPEVCADFVAYRSIHSLNKRPPPQERTLYKYIGAVQWAIQTGAPANEVQPYHYELRPKGMKGQSHARTRYLTADEIRRYLAAITEPAVRAAFVVWCLVGGRRGDAERIGPEDIGKDEYGWWCRIEGASKGRDRKVVVVDDFAPLLTKYVIPELPITYRWKSGAESVYRFLHQAAELAGVDYASPNDVRSSFCVLMLDLGYDARFVAQCMGTSEAMIQDHYDRARGQESGYQRMRLQYARKHGRSIEVVKNTAEILRELLGEDDKEVAKVG